MLWHGTIVNGINLQCTCHIVHAYKAHKMCLCDMNDLIVIILKLINIRCIVKLLHQFNSFAAVADWQHGCVVS